MSDVTRILSDIEQGDRSAAEQLLPLQVVVCRAEFLSGTSPVVKKDQERAQR